MASIGSFSTFATESPDNLKVLQTKKTKKNEKTNSLVADGYIQPRDSSGSKDGCFAERAET